MSQSQTPAIEASPRWSTRRVLLFLVPLFLFYAFPLGFWPKYVGANETAHLYLAMALYDRGETNLDNEVRDYIANQDLIYRNNSYFSNKPPGPAFWLLPAAFVVDVFTHGILELAPLLYFGRVLMLSLPFVVFLFFLGRTLEKMASPAVAWGLTLAYALGTSAGPYAILYFGHGLAAMALCAGFLLVLRGNAWMHVAAGLACGLGVMSEYQTLGIAVVTTFLAAFDSSGRFNLKLLTCFALGAIPMAVCLFFYNSISFGGSTEVAYVSEFKSFNLETKETYGFTTPSFMKLLAMWFSPALGLFFHSPWLLLFFPAAISAFRRKTPRRLVLITAVLASLVLPLTLCSHDYWIGGAIAGPRYLAAGLAFMLFPIAAFLDRCRGKPRTGLLAGLVACGLVSVVLFTCILATVPYINTFQEHLFQNPVTSHVVPFLNRGLGMMTVAMFFGASIGTSNLLFGLLFLSVAAGFAVPSLVRTSNANRMIALVGCGAGIVLFLAWTQIGESSNPRCASQLNLVAENVNLEGLPSKNGNIMFIKRASAMEPTSVHYDVHHDSKERFLDSVVRPGTKIFEVADGFKFLQGSVWSRRGYLLCSDPRNNTIYNYSPDGTLSVYRNYSGYQGQNVVNYIQPGSNGLAEDREGRLIIAEYGRQRLTRLEKDGTVTVLAERYKGTRLNSPGDVAVKSDGSIYFTDPKVKLLKAGRPSWEKLLPHRGIYRLAGEKLQLLYKDLAGPRGLAFSPDENYLYVGDWFKNRKALVRFEVHPDGTLSQPVLFHDMRSHPVQFPTDGLVVDRKGNVYVTGNGGFWIVTPSGKRLDFFRLPFPATSLAWGGEDARTLYISGVVSLYRMRVEIPGVR